MLQLIDSNASINSELGGQKICFYSTKRISRKTFALLDYYQYELYSDENASYKMKESIINVVCASVS